MSEYNEVCLQQYEERQDYLTSLWETREWEQEFSVTLYNEANITGNLSVGNGETTVLIDPINLGYNIDDVKNNIIKYFKQKLEDTKNWELVEDHYELFLCTEDLLIEDIEKELAGC